MSIHDEEGDASKIHPRHRIFADEWLTGAATGRQFNGVAAYEHAGYKLAPSNPSANPSKLLRHPHVQAYIQKRMDEMMMGATETLLRMSAIARAEVGNILTTNHSGHLTIDPAEVIKLKKYVKSFHLDSNGQPKIEFHDSMRALENIAKIHGLLKTGLEVTGQGGAPVTMRVEFVEAKDGAPVAELEAEETEAPEDFSEFDEG